jgi:sigma-B regulation protein RsbU (phosphoserine phosphatase)
MPVCTHFGVENSRKSFDIVSINALHFAQIQFCGDSPAPDPCNGHHSQKKLLKNLNNDFVQKFGAIHSFFSCILVDIYPEKNKIVYASAGHPDQIIQRKNWDILNLSRTGKIMGLMKDVEFEEVEISFEKGDKLFLFTDGLFEEFNTNKEEFGEKQVVSIIKAYSDSELKELFPILMDNLNTFLENSSRQDDITFIGVEHDRE